MWVSCLLRCSRGSIEPNPVHIGNTWWWHIESHREWKGKKKKAQIHGSNTHLTHTEIGTNLHQKSGEICKDTTWTTISKCNRDSAWSAGETAYIWSNVSHWSRRCSESPVFRAISWSRRWGIHAANLSNDMCLLTCCFSQLILQQLISHSSR